MKSLLAIAVLMLAPLLMVAQAVGLDSTQWAVDSLGFSYGSLCRMEATMVQPGETWPSASFNDQVCQVPDFLQEVPPGKVGLVIPYHGGDCHATFDFHYRVDHETKQLIYQVVDHWGRCRAGGHYFVRFTQVPAPPEGYQLLLQMLRTDD